MNKLLSAMTLLGLIGVSAPVSANLIVNGSFEDDDASASPYYIRYNGAAHPTGWTQSADGVDLIHNTYTQAPTVLVDAQDGDQFIDLNTASQYGQLHQDVAVVSGQTYELSLWLSQWATNSAGTVAYSLYDGNDLVNPLVSGSYAVTSAAGWVERTVQATAVSSSMRVVIAPISGVQQAAPGLDNVSLVAVPEPASLGLLAALGGVMLLGRRR